MYSCSPTLIQMSLKIPLGQWFFKFWSRDYFIETKTRFLGRRFEMEHFFNVLFAE